MCTKWQNVYSILRGNDKLHIDDNNNNTYNTTRHVTCQFQERERGGQIE